MSNDTACQGDGRNEHCAVRFGHAHCICGLPMKTHARACQLCEMEDLAPWAHDESRFEWDGESYPSLRNNRLSSPAPEPYLNLARAIGGDRSRLDVVRR